MVPRPPGRRARCEHQGLEGRGRSRTRNPADWVLRPLVLPKHLAQAVLGMDTLEKAKAAGSCCASSLEGLLSGPEILRNKVHTG